MVMLPSLSSFGIKNLSQHMGLVPTSMLRVIYATLHEDVTSLHTRDYTCYKNTYVLHTLLHLKKWLCLRLLGAGSLGRSRRDPHRLAYCAHMLSRTPVVLLNYSWRHVIV